MSTATAILALAAPVLLAGVLIVYARRWKTYHKKELVEDVLKLISAGDPYNQPIGIDQLAGALRRSRKTMLRIMQQIELMGLVESHGGGFLLTESGRELAVHIIRAHRLLERYLTDDARVPLHRVHNIAERQEHRFTEEQVKALNEHLGHPETDPHGDPIPDTGGSVTQQPRFPLTDWPLHQPARVVHVEDEPTQAMNQILKAGIEPGSIVTVTEKDQEGLQFVTDRQTRRLAPAVAANVHVNPAGPAVETGLTLERLSDLPKNIPAYIVRLADQCRGFTRRRLLDLGFTPGAEVLAELDAPGRASRAYRIRDTLIALRSEQARHILITIRPDTTAEQ